MCVQAAPQHLDRRPAAFSLILRQLFDAKVRSNKYDNSIAGRIFADIVSISIVFPASQPKCDKDRCSALDLQKHQMTAKGSFARLFAFRWHNRCVSTNSPAVILMQK
jgi:hypothetical protein